MIHKFFVTLEWWFFFFFFFGCKVETLLFLGLQISLLSHLFVIVYNKHLDTQSFQAIHISNITKIMHDIHFANMRKLECRET